MGPPLRSIFFVILASFSDAGKREGEREKRKRERGEERKREEEREGEGRREEGGGGIATTLQFLRSR